VAPQEIGVEMGSDKRRAAFVTGASYGIGASVAVALARDGFDVAVSDLTADTLGDTVSSVEAAGGRIDHGPDGQAGRGIR